MQKKLKNLVKTKAKKRTKNQLYLKLKNIKDDHQHLNEKIYISRSISWWLIWIANAFISIKCSLSFWFLLRPSKTFDSSVWIFEFSLQTNFNHSVFLCANSKSSNWESSLSGQLLWCLNTGLKLGQCSSNGSGLFQSQILWLVFLALVEFSQVFLLGLINDGQYTCNWFAHFAA